MRFKKDEIIFLFGAGISADAGIPTSVEMIEKLENLVNNNNEWLSFKDLYFLVKSGVEFSYGIQGKKSLFNIEILVNTLTELEKKEMHPLYPFIGSWHIKFNEVIGNNFNRIGTFKKKIIEQLKSWMQPSDLRESKYLKKIEDLQRDINFSIRIFTLNYDLLLEKNLSDVRIERGFDEDRKWDYKRFESYDEPNIYLYKLHGSIDWERNRSTQILKYTDSILEEPDLIFGTQYKMQYVDPYLFMISEFRYYCFKAKLIVCLGYSFSDEHINSILSQATSTNNDIKIFSLAYNEDEQKIYNVIPSNKTKIKIITNKKAKEFFENDFKKETFGDLFEKDEKDLL
jgi:hypothetical protein